MHSWPRAATNHKNDKTTHFLRKTEAQNGAHKNDSQKSTTITGNMLILEVNVLSKSAKQTAGKLTSCLQQVCTSSTEPGTWCFASPEQNEKTQSSLKDVFLTTWCKSSKKKLHPEKQNPKRFMTKEKPVAPI